MPAKHFNIHHTRNKTSISKSKNGGFLLYLVYLVSIMEPLATAPQIYTIWINKKTEGVSTLSWSGFFVAGCIWLM